MFSASQRFDRIIMRFNFTNIDDQSPRCQKNNFFVSESCKNKYFGLWKMQCHRTILSDAYGHYEEKNVSCSNKYAVRLTSL